MDSFVFKAAVSSPKRRTEAVLFPNLIGGPYGQLAKAAATFRPRNERPKTVGEPSERRRQGRKQKGPELQKGPGPRRRKRAWEEHPKLERDPWDFSRWTSTDAHLLDAKRRDARRSVYEEEVFKLPGPRPRRKRARDKQKVHPSTSLPTLKMRLRDAREEVKRESISIEENVRAIKTTLPRDFLFEVGMRSFVLERGLQVLQRVAKRMMHLKAATAFEQWLIHTRGMPFKGACAC